MPAGNLARIKHPKVRHLLEASQNRAAEVKPLTIPASDAAQLWQYIQALENANVKLQGLVPQFKRTKEAIPPPDPKDPRHSIDVLILDPNPRREGEDKRVREAVLWFDRPPGTSGAVKSYWAIPGAGAFDLYEVEIWCEMPGVPK